MTRTQGQSRKNTDRHADISARLFLEAVFPSLDVLLQDSSKAQSILGIKDFVLRLSATGCGSQTYHFENERLTVAAKPCQPHLHLHFQSAHDLQKLLHGQLPTIPHIEFPQNFCPSLLPVLPLLLLQLDRALKPPLSEAALLLHLRLLLSIAYKALPHLAQHDPETRQILAHTPPGILHIQLAKTDIRAWANWDGQTLTTSTSDRPPRFPDAQITFLDPLIAYHTFNETLDTHAAIGLHRLIIEGHLPLADHFSLLLERLPHFLPK